MCTHTCKLHPWHKRRGAVKSDAGISISDVLFQSMHFVNWILFQIYTSILGLLAITLDLDSSHLCSIPRLGRMGQSLILLEFTSNRSPSRQIDIEKINIVKSLTIITSYRSTIFLVSLFIIIFINFH